MSDSHSRLKRFFVPALVLTGVLLFGGGTTASAQPIYAFPEDLTEHYAEQDLLSFGSYDGTAIEWRILDPSETLDGQPGVFLLSHHILDRVVYRADGEASNAWDVCAAKVWCDATSADPDNFLPIEVAALHATTVADKQVDVFAASPLKAEKLFLLSADEAATYLPDAHDRVASMKGEAADHWWLRSPKADDYRFAGIVGAEDGSIYPARYFLNLGLRPACNLDFAHIAWLWADEPTPGQSHTWKAVLLDDESNASFDEVTRTDDTLCVSYRCDEGHIGWKVAAVVSDSDDGAIRSVLCSDESVSSTEGSASFSLPDDFDTNRPRIQLCLLQETDDRATSCTTALQDVDVPTPTQAHNLAVAKSFTDVWADYLNQSKSLWYVDDGSLSYVVDGGIMSGYTDENGASAGLFGPNDIITRAQVACILYRYADGTSFGSTTDPALFASDVRFTDEEAGMYYTAAINWAQDKGIMTGDAHTGYSTVRPHDGVTRQELCTMIRRFALSQGITQAGPIDRSNIEGMDEVSPWAKSGVNWTVSWGIVGGFDNGDGTYTMAPEQSATRSQMTKMVTVLLRDVLN